MEEEEEDKSRWRRAKTRGRKWTRTLRRGGRTKGKKSERKKDRSNRRRSAISPHVSFLQGSSDIRQWKQETLFSYFLSFVSLKNLCSLSWQTQLCLMNITGNFVFSFPSSGSNLCHWLICNINFAASYCAKLIHCTHKGWKWVSSDFGFL